MSETVPFGKQFREKYFGFDSKYVPLNHGSYGAAPKPVLESKLKWFDIYNNSPDKFFFLDIYDRVGAARRQAGKLVNADFKNLVFVQNASIGVNTVLRSLKFKKGDVVIGTTTTYGACTNTLKFLQEKDGIILKTIRISNSTMGNADIISAYKKAIDEARAEYGPDSVKLLFIDGVSSMPGCRLPWESIVELAKKENILSFVDAAHSIGMVPNIDLTANEPDFYVTNLHKWFYVPSPAAILYVKEKFHREVQTFPISHSFIPDDESELSDIIANDVLGNKFNFIGTSDYINYLVLPDAIKFRKEICGGEEKIYEYCTKLAKEAAQLFSEGIDGQVLRSPDSNTEYDTFLVNVFFSLDKYGIPEEKYSEVLSSITKKLLSEHNVYIPCALHEGKPFLRLSAQVYLDIDDFKYGLEAFKQVLEDLKA